MNCCCIKLISVQGGQWSQLDKGRRKQRHFPLRSDKGRFFVIDFAVERNEM